MPPKGKKKREPAENEENKEKSQEPNEPTQKEIALKTQLDGITEQLCNMRIEIDDLRQENDFLQQEAQQTRVETHEYLAYMSKKTQKRQSAVISLSDRNAERVKEIHEKKEEVIKKYDVEKSELSKIILAKEAELLNIEKELEELNEYRLLQNEQQSEIAQLEKRVAEMRTKHNEAVQKLKAKFLEDKNEFHSQSEDQLNKLSREAKKEAQLCLEEHTVKIKQENRVLRKELLELIKKTRALHKHKLELEDQRKILTREKQYATNLQEIRKTRAENMYKTYGLDACNDNKQT